MHLTRILNFYKKFTKVPGLLYQGKNRVYKPITPLKLKNSVKWMLMEDDNRILLNNPYITEAEEGAFLQATGGINAKKRELLAQKIKARKFKMNQPLEDHLEHLNVNKRWE